MKSAFAAEDARKDKNFQEFYEGMMTVSDLSKNRIGLHLEDGRKLIHITTDS